MKIFCIGKNYLQSEEVQNTILEDRPCIPTLFMKPDSAILKNGQPFFIPDFSKEISYEVELVVRVNRLGKNIAHRFAHRYYNEVTLGVSFTAKDLHKQLMENGQPWELSKGFDNSAAIGEFISLDKLGKSCENISFDLTVDDVVHRANSAEMVHHIDALIEFISRYYTLKIGDLIFTGSPICSFPVQIGQRFIGKLENEEVLNFYAR